MSKASRVKRGVLELVSRKEAETDTIEVAGKRVARFSGKDLTRIADILITAGGVKVRMGDRAGDIRQWKLVCGYNYAQVEQALATLKARIDKHLEPTEEWMKARERIAELWMECIGTEMDEQYPDSLADGDDADLICKVEYKDRVDAFLARLTNDDVLADKIYARRAVLDGVLAIMNEPIDVEIAQVAWSKVPCGLSGGYMRELTWMYVEIPPKLAALFQP